MIFILLTFEQIFILNFGLFSLDEQIVKVIIYSCKKSNSFE